MASPAVVVDAVIDPGAEAAAVADEFRASRGRALMARVVAAQRASQSQVRAVVGALGGTTLYAAQAVNAVTVRIPRSALAALRGRSDVAFVEIDEPRHADLDHVPSAMLIDTFWSAGLTGGSIDVAVIDTGLYVGHEAFGAKAGSIVSAVFHDAAMHRPEYYDIATDPDDYGGHGTFVSGMIFSQGSAAAASRRGVSHGIDKLFNLKAGYATTSGGGSSLLSDVMRAVDWSLVQADATRGLQLLLRRAHLGRRRQLLAVLGRDRGRLRQGRDHLGRQQRSAGWDGGLARHCLQRHQRRQRGEQGHARPAATT